MLSHCQVPRAGRCRGGPWPLLTGSYYADAGPLDAMLMHRCISARLRSGGLRHAAANRARPRHPPSFVARGTANGFVARPSPSFASSQTALRSSLALVIPSRSAPIVGARAFQSAMSRPCQAKRGAVDQGPVAARSSRQRQWQRQWSEFIAQAALRWVWGRARRFGGVLAPPQHAIRIHYRRPS